MAITIRDIAREAGVSIATVSHVINGTRYVKPKLMEKILQTIRNTNCQAKAGRKPGTARLGEKSVIAVIVPNVEGFLFTKMIICITQLCESGGYFISIYLTFDSAASEKRILENLVGSRQTVGTVIAPCGLDSKYYQKIHQRDMPLVRIEQTVLDHSIPRVVANGKNITRKGTQTLLNNGHRKIDIPISDRGTLTVDRQLTGFLDTMYDAGIHCDDSNIVKMDLYDNKNCERAIISHYEDFKPTAYIARGNQITLILISTLQKLAVDILSQLPVTGFSDESWCHLFGTLLTTFSHDCHRMARNALRLLFNQVDGKTEIEEVHILSLLGIHKSVKMIGRGPYGETTVSPDNLDPTPTEVEELQKHKYRVDASFHYGGTNWAAMREKGLHYILSGCGVNIVSVTDSSFDSNLQAIQLESLRMQGTDTIVAIPVDDTATSNELRQLSREAKLIFVSNVPDGMSKGDYYSLVPTNGQESSRNGIMLLGKHFKKEDKVVVGFTVHGGRFLGTYLRDMIAEQATREEYPNITIVKSEPFYQIENTCEVVKKIILAHPEIKGLCVSWEGPVLGAIRAIRELNHYDIRIVTFDLDYEIVGILANEDIILGLNIQRAYDQGVAAGQATAKALLNQRGYEYIGISPRIVERQNLLSAWREVMRENAPDELAKMLKSELSKKWNFDTKNRISAHRRPSYPD